MQQIPLSQGKFALVDDADFPLLSEFRWCYRGEMGKEGYAVRHARTNGKDRLLYLHRHLMQPPPGHEVIFRNGDPRDIRLENLECITRRALMARNSVHNLPKPLAQTVQLLGALNRQIRRRSRDAEQDRRPA